MNIISPSDLKKYRLSGGMIVILKLERSEKKFLLLPQRTNDAKINPGKISGFFGYIENISEVDLEIERECCEELFFYDKIAGNLIDFKKKGSKLKGEYYKAITDWQKILGVSKTSSRKLDIEKVGEAVKIGGKTINNAFIVVDNGINIIQFRSLPISDEIIPLDGEYDKDGKKPWDRKLLLFDYNDFLTNWGAKELTSTGFYKTGRKFDQVEMFSRDQFSITFQGAFDQYKSKLNHF